MFTYYVVVAMHCTHSEPVRHTVCVYLAHPILHKATTATIINAPPTAMEQSTLMYDLTDARNRAELVEHLRLYDYDRIDILRFYEGDDLPEFITSEYDAIMLANEVEKA